MPNRWGRLIGGLGALAMVLATGDAAHAVRREARAPVASASNANAASTTPFTVAVLGDGFAEAMAEGLRLDFAGDPGIAILPATHAPHGLADTVPFDWTATAKALLDGQPVDAAVIMLGAGDMQPMTVGAETVETRTPRWQALYGDRIEALTAVFKARRIPVTWVGLPIVGDDRSSGDFVDLNEISRERAVKAGATFVDSWDAFADEGGRYSAFGPDRNGQTTKLRRADGFDFTRAGAIKLASFVEADLRRDREAAKSDIVPGTSMVLSNQTGFDSALEIDVTAQIRREAGLPALAGLPQPGPSPSGRPVGPLITLTAPAVAPDGRLVAATVDPTPLTGAGSGTPVERWLTEGQPIPPRPGRSDDFAWPRR